MFALLALAHTTALAVAIPAYQAEPEPWHVEAAGDYRQTTSDNMQFCRNFGGQGFVFTKDADCHGPQDFYRGSYYAGEAAPAEAASE